MIIAETVRHHLAAFLNILYPDPCAVCGGTLLYHESFVCTRCATRIMPLAEPVCALCARELPRFRHSRSRVCGPCRTRSWHFDAGWSAIRYDDITKHLFHEIKFKKRRAVLKVFEQTFKERLATIPVPDPHTVIIPVPLDRNRQREREFNQSELLARMVSAYFHIPCLTNVLYKIKNVPPQSLLGRQERLENLTGVFMTRHASRIARKAVIVVDDVFTTGATVEACATALKQAGARTVISITLARTV